MFFLILHHFANSEKIIVRPQPAIMMPPPIWYLGSWLRRKKYGENQCEILDTQLAIAIRAARLVRGRGTTVVSQESWMLRPTNGPEQSKMREKYRAPTLSVEIIMIAPIRVMVIEPMMCQLCSSILPELQETASVTKYAMRYGGAWTRYVSTFPKPRVPTMEGKKSLKLWAMMRAKCIPAKNQAGCVVSESLEWVDIGTLTVRVSDGQHDTSPHVTFVILTLSTGGHESTILRHLRLFWGEEVCACVVGPVGKTPEADDRDENGDNTLKEEEPLP